jgi:hypothetical protein
VQAAVGAACDAEPLLVRRKRRPARADGLRRDAPAYS